MTDVMLGPLFTLVSIALPVGIACLAVATTVAVAPRVVVLLRQRSYERATVGERLYWTLRLDPGAAADRDGAVRLVAALHPAGRRGVSAWASGWPQLGLAIRWVDGRASWEIEAPRQLGRSVEMAVAAAFPGAELERAVPPSMDVPSLRLAVRGEPPETAGTGTSSNLGAILVELLARLPDGASGAWRLHVTPLPPAKDQRSDDAPGKGEMLLDSFLNRPSRAASAPARALPARAPGPLFSVTADLAASSTNPAAARAWLFDAIGAVGSLRAAGWTIEATVGGRSHPIRVSARDLAELWGLAGAAEESRPVDAIRSRRLPAPLVMAQPGLRAIGLDAGRPVLVPESLFARHFVLLGRTGSGKSTELVALAADDLRAGRGFTFIDPHGDAVARLLDAVPPEQAHRVHLLELAEKDHPRAFNPIELDGADPELVAAQFVDTMSDLYFAGLASPPHRQLQYLRSALMTLLLRANPEGVPWTLESLNRLLIDPIFREEIVNGLKDPILEAFWKHQWPRRGGSDPSADALTSKLAAFLSYPSIRAIVSAPVSTIRPRRIMDAGEVLLVDLSRAGGDNAWLFGGLVIARYYVDALGRQAMAPAARLPHTLYVDEVQNFDTSAIRGTLAQGRKFALQAGLATQYFDSLGRELQRGIRANVATTMLLQPSADDTRLLRDEMAPLTERDLLNLPRYRMAVRTELGGQARVLTADVLPEVPSLGSASLIRRLSNARDAQATVT
jgi:Helicase HerA, central domain